jgi:HEAT repeat protein
MTKVMQRSAREMATLSRETGGSLREVGGTDDMTAAFRDLGAGLRGRYLVSYRSDRTKGGGWRSVRVTVRRPDCVVRARQGVIGTRPIGDFLLADLQSGNAPTRRKAAEWLATMPAEGGGEALLGALNDRDAQVRQAAAASLGRIREPRAITPLVAMLQTADLGGRLAAAESLQVFGPAAVPELVAALEAPPMAGSGAVEGRIATLDVLAEIGDARAVEAMIHLATAQPPPPRNDHGDVILTGANERRAALQMRLAALHALGAMGSDDGLPSLQRAARERSAEIRAAGFTALRDHASPQAFKLLHQMGQEGEPDPALRDTARATLIEGFMTLARRGTLTTWLERPLGAAIFSFAAADAAADAARRPPGSWAPLFDAVGGAAATAGFLDAAASHLPEDAAMQARSLGKRLRLQVR